MAAKKRFLAYNSRNISDHFKFKQHTFKLIVKNKKEIKINSHLFGKIQMAGFSLITREPFKKFSTFYQDFFKFDAAQYW